MGEVQSIEETLSRAGIEVGDSQSDSGPDSPWFIKVLIGLSAWVTGLFIVAFVGLALSSIWDNLVGLSLSGIALLAVAATLLLSRANEFADQLALAFSLAGQLLLAFAIGKAAGWDRFEWGSGLFLLQAALCILPHFVHRMMVSTFAGMALTMALAASGLAYMASAILLALASACWCLEWRRPQWMRVCQALGFGLTLALLVVQYSLRWNGGALLDEFSGFQWAAPWMGELLNVVIAAAVFGYCARHQVVKWQQWLFGLVFLLLLWGASLNAYGLMQAVVLLVLGFYGHNRVLMGLAAAALLAAIGSYYYLLEVSFLVKSATLCALGLLLFAARWLYQRFWPEGEA